MELRREPLRCRDVDKRLILVALTVIVTMAGCSDGGQAPTSAAPTLLVTTPSPIAVTGTADCAAPAVGHPLDPFALVEQDNGRTYKMARCQAVAVLLLNKGHDGCHWEGVVNTDDRVLGLVPVSQAPLPGGGTYAVYRANAPGQGGLTSSLACVAGNPTQWAVTVTVGG